MLMFLNALFGVNTIDELPGDDLARCQAVKDAVTFDDQNSQVTFHLQSVCAISEPSGNPIPCAVGPGGMIAQGDWDAPAPPGAIGTIQP